MSRMTTFPMPIILAALICLVGCGSKPTPKTEDPGATNLRKIGQAYDLFSSSKRRPPKNVDELKPMFKESGDKTDPETILRSKRDGQPFTIYYGAQMDSDARGIILAHEQNGADGKRYALRLDRMVVELSDEEFANAEFAEPINSR